MRVAALIIVGLAAAAGAAALWGAIQGVVRLGRFVKDLLNDDEV